MDKKVTESSGGREERKGRVANSASRSPRPQFPLFCPFFAPDPRDPAEEATNVERNQLGTICTVIIIISYEFLIGQNSNLTPRVRGIKQKK